MTSGNLKRFAAYCVTTALVLAGMLVLGFGLTAMAQSGAGSSNGLEGTWRAQVTVSDCQTGEALRTFPALFAFAKGGTVTFTTAGQLPSRSHSLAWVSGTTWTATLTVRCPRSSFLAPPEPGYRHTGSRGSSRSVTTGTSLRIQLGLKSSTPTET